MPFRSHRLPLRVFCLVFVACACPSPSDAQQGPRVWAADALVKVQPSTAVPDRASDRVSVETVRGEYENAQAVVTAGSEDLTLTLSTEPMTGPDGPRPRLRAAFLGFVPVRKGTPNTPDTHLVAKPPADLPDPILSAASVTVPAGTNQPVWLIVQTPRTCAPGVYRSALTVAAGGSNLRVPVTVRVRDITLPPERTLQITNWFSMGNIAAYHGVTMWSESFWKVLDVYARFMADYRQNAARTMLFDLITASEDPQGRLTFDFTRFDRFVEMLEKAGLIGTIEGSHLAYRTDWKTHVLKGHRPVTTLPDGSQKKWVYVEVDSPEQREFLAQFLPALVKHLQEKGWRDRYVQHLSDEPVAANAAAYNALAAMVREFAPGVKTIDATMCREVAGSVDIWVPQQSEIDRNMEFFESRRKLGEQVWIYTCLNPKGRYLNRFIDYHLLSPRLIHWMNFKYGFEGYLHWGLNFQLGDAFKNVERGYPNPNNLPAGDSHIVYPGRYGPIPSIRFDAMRDGIEDYELLRLLAHSRGAGARRICDSVVRSMTDYTLDPSEFRKARARLLDALEKAH